MNILQRILAAAKELLSPEERENFLSKVDIPDHSEAAPAGAILMGMYVLEAIGFPQTVDRMLGEDHRTIQEMQDAYLNRDPLEPSTGTMLSLLVADMIACPRNVARAYQIESLAKAWRTGPLLGIEPNVLNDDRILRSMSKLGLSNAMTDILFMMVADVSQEADIPLNTFFCDTTCLQLSGVFDKAEKVCAGRGRDSFSQLIVGIVVAAGSRLPVHMAVHAGNTNDSSTVPEIYEAVHQVADDGTVEITMDRGYMTAKNAIFLEEKRDERQVYWISPLKTGLSPKEVRNQVKQAWDRELWKPILYRSNKEVAAKIEPPLQAYETTWTLTDVIKPPLEPGQTRRPKGSIQRVNIETRCVFYRHRLNAEREKARREQERHKLDTELHDFTKKLNRGKMCEQKYCESKLQELLKGRGSVRYFLDFQLSVRPNGAMAFSWEWDEAAWTEEKLYDGVFAILTNYPTGMVRSNGLITRYRSRDQVEVSFKDMKGLLALEKVVVRLPERIDAYLFLKVIACFVLALLRCRAKEAGIKTTEKAIQESMGDVLLTTTEILPLGVRSYAVARDTPLNRFFRDIFNLPDLTKLIDVLNKAEIEIIDTRIRQWLDDR